MIAAVSQSIEEVLVDSVEGDGSARPAHPRRSRRAVGRGGLPPDELDPRVDVGLLAGAGGEPRRRDEYPRSPCLPSRAPANSWSWAGRSACPRHTSLADVDAVKAERILADDAVDAGIPGRAGLLDGPELAVAHRREQPQHQLLEPGRGQRQRTAQDIPFNSGPVRGDRLLDELLRRCRRLGQLRLITGSPSGLLRGGVPGPIPELEIGGVCLQCLHVDPLGEPVQGLPADRVDPHPPARRGIGSSPACLR